MKTIVSAVALLFAGSAVLAAAEQGEHHHMAMHGQMNMAGQKSAGGQVNQKTCPVTGEPVNPKVFTEQDGQKVYFCCENCVAKFKADQPQYLTALYRQIYPQRVQVTCPVMGEAVDGQTSLDLKGEKVEFCCSGCGPKFKADPGKYATKLEAAYTDQVHCPVTGQAINPEFSADYQGKKVYFHSADAKKAFETDRAKYADKLIPEVGVLARGATADGDLVLTAADSGKAVHQRKDVKTVAYQGKNYFVSNADDAKRFNANAAGEARKVQAELQKRQNLADHWFTCSMDSDVLQKGPGKCPKCGMKLTLVAGATDAGPAQHGTMNMSGHGGMPGGHHNMGGSGHMGH